MPKLWRETLKNHCSKNAVCSKQAITKKQKLSEKDEKEEKEMRKRAKNEITSFLKVPIDTDKMSEITSLLSIIICSVESLENELGRDNSNSVALTIVEDLIRSL